MGKSSDSLLDAVKNGPGKGVVTMSGSQQQAFRFGCLLAIAVVSFIAAGCSSGNSDAPKSVNAGEANAKQAQEYIAKWPTMGMWLPDTEEVSFFSKNLSDVRDVLAATLSDNNSKVRQRAAYVIEKIGARAGTLEPVLVECVQKEKIRLVRMYLYDALRSVAAKSDAAREALQDRYETLRKNEGSPQREDGEDGYTADDERMSVAAALFVLGDTPERKKEYQDFVLRWLTPPAPKLSAADREDYWEHRWCAVIYVEHMRGADEAIPLLKAMLQEPDAKPWVEIHVPRALESLSRNDRE